MPATLSDPSLNACDRLRPVGCRIVAGTKTHIQQQHDVLLTRRQVEARCGLSTSSIYWLMREGLFPEPIRIGRRAVRWPTSEIGVAEPE